MHDIIPGSVSMLVKCSWCEKNFNSDRYGRQFCPHCGAELEIPAPGAGAVAPEPRTLRPGEGGEPQQPAGQQGPGATQYFDPWAQPGGQAGGARQQGEQPPGATVDAAQQPPGGAGGGWLPPAGGGFPPDGPPQDLDAPWERRGELGLVPAFVETWKQASLDPSRFFARLKPTGIGDAFLYGWLCAVLGGVLGALWNVPLTLYSGNDAAAAWLPLIAVPIVAALGLLLNAGVLHLACMLLGCGSRGFDGTMRVVAYAQGPNLLSIVPFVGGVAAMVWAVVIEINGLAQMHRIPRGKATLAVLLPGLVLFLCCACALIPFVMIGWGAALEAAGGSF